MNRLVLQYNPEDIYHGEIKIKVESDGFSGHSSAWFSKNQLDQFGNALMKFPITSEAKPLLEGGFWEHGALDQTHVSICIEPAGPRGALRVIVALATPSWDLGRVDLHNVRARFLIKYSDLDNFLPSYREMVVGRKRSATLEALPT